MKNFIAALIILGVFVTLVACQSTTNAATSSQSSADAAEIDRDVDAALHKLFESTPLANELREKTVGILMFPDVLKA